MPSLPVRFANFYKNPVYNFTVEDYHTYYVGQGEVLVHNCGGKAAINLQKQAGHIKGTAQYKNRIKQGKGTSTFFGEKSAERLTQIANTKGTPVPGRPQIKEYDFGFSVGTSPKGGMQSKVRVSTDKKGKIHGTPSGPVRN